MRTRKRIERQTIDGIPIWYCPSEGPTSACLMFRVGHTDELLPSRGITHLVEHLALWQLGQLAFSSNGHVDGVTTAFVAHGRPTQVSGFIRDLCSALQELPAHRVAQEAEVLWTEAAGARSSIVDDMLRFRFGARTYGLGSYVEFGLNWIDAHDLDAWSRYAFTRDNAVVWVSGELPADLSVDLPDGARLEPPRVEPRILPLPAAIEGPEGGVSVTGLTPRSVAATTILQVLARRLQLRLRTEAGVSYTVQSGYAPLDRDVAHWAITADCLPHQASAITRELVVGLTGLADDPIRDEEVQIVVDHLEHAGTDPSTRQFELHMAATNELIGFQVEDPRMLADETRRLDSTKLADAVQTMISSSILTSPPSDADPPEPFRRLPSLRGNGVRGRKFADRRGGAGGPALVVGDRGISWSLRGNVVSVWWDRLSAAIWSSGGTRLLIGADGASIEVREREWMNGRLAIDAIDAAVPPERWAPNRRQSHALGVPSLIRQKPPPLEPQA
jgi:zinc protease